MTSSNSFPTLSIASPTNLLSKPLWVTLYDGYLSFYEGPFSTEDSCNVINLEDVELFQELCRGGNDMKMIEIKVKGKVSLFLTVWQERISKYGENMSLSEDISKSKADIRNWTNAISAAIATANNLKNGIEMNSKAEEYLVKTFPDATKYDE